MNPIAIEVLKMIMKDRNHMTYNELEFNSKVVSYICNLFNISEDEEDMLWIELFETDIENQFIKTIENND